MTLKSKNTKSKYLRIRQEGRQKFYYSALHKQSIAQNFNLFCHHIQSDFEFTTKAPLYNPMDEINLIPFIAYLLEQLLTLIALFYLAFVYTTLSLFFIFLFSFNLTEIKNSFYNFTNASLCFLMVMFDILINITLLIISPIMRTLATYMPIEEEASTLLIKTN